MSTDTQINNYMKFKKPKKEYGKYIGVYMSDRLPINIQKPCCLIANYDPYGKAGSHWVGIAFPSFENADFFDSFGYKPDAADRILSDKTDFTDFLINNSSTKNFNFNNIDLQMVNTDVCGEYCINFLFCGLPIRPDGYINPLWSNLLKMSPNIRDSYIREIIKIRGL